MSDNHPALPELKVSGTGSFQPPAGLTQEEADRLAREADEQRKER